MVASPGIIGLWHTPQVFAAAASGLGSGMSAANGSNSRADSPSSTGCLIAGISTIESLGVSGRRMPDGGSPGTLISPWQMPHRPNAPAMLAGTHIGALHDSHAIRI